MVVGALEVNNRGEPLYRKPTLGRMRQVPKNATKGQGSHRELIDTGNDKRFVRRDDKGQFDEVADVGRSIAQDRKQQAKTKVPPGQGDRGDQKKRK